MVNGKAGKGSKYRPVDWDKYSKNWNRIFGKNKEKKTNERNKSSKTSDR